MLVAGSLARFLYERQAKPRPPLLNKTNETRRRHTVTGDADGVSEGRGTNQSAASLSIPSSLPPRAHVGEVSHTAAIDQSCGACTLRVAACACPFRVRN